MSATQTIAERPDTAAADTFDAIIIGAGISGMFMLYRLRELGMTARVFEAGTNVGGTWYWNRYPGARFDSESWTYGYSFSKELLQEWDWKEHFSPQPDTLEYLNYVADKFDLRRDMQFRSAVKAAHWDDAANQWTVTLESGQQARSQFLLTAIGILSDDFKAKEAVPHFIDALEHENSAVRETAVIALRDLTGREFRFDPSAAPAERAKRVKAWRDWWYRNGQEFLAS